MLKHVLVNSKKVPVPVPVKTLAQALAWLEETLVPAGQTITRVALDDQVLIPGPGPVPEGALLTPASRLEIQIESPADLTLQTLDTTRNLASVINGGLKILAVQCWQCKGSARPTELDTVCHDLDLVLELIAHATTLLDPGHSEVAALQGIGVLISRTASALKLAQAHSDWKGCAKLLLNRLEPLLKDLADEAEGLQIHLMAQMSATLSRTGKP